MSISALTFSEVFETLVWSSAEVQSALERVSRENAEKISDPNAFLCRYGSYRINFHFDVEGQTFWMTKGRVIKGKTKPLYIVPHERGSRKRKVPQIKVEDDTVITAWPDKDAEAVRRVWQKLASMFKLISDGRVIVSARTQTGDAVTLRVSDWSTQPETLWFTWQENSLKRYRKKRLVQVFECLEFNLSITEREQLTRNGPISELKVETWMAETFFERKRFCDKETVWELAKDRFPNLSHLKFKEVWKNTAPKDWKRAGKFPEKDKNINLINQIRQAI
ncbi:hypothetical protein [Roseibium alexandrii]|uniref:hypothetical protein n=1 Tax=Roseibium alexandrii TaxID=388408 RepID=UPI0006E171FA|nr:hypothetical protein [Roseibium alexandrii]